MEIKARQRWDRGDLTALREVKKGLGKEWRGELIIDQGNKIEQIGEDDIWAVPSCRLFN